MVLEAAELIDDGFTIAESLEATIIPLFDAKHRRFITKLTTKYIRNPSLKKRRAS